VNVDTGEFRALTDQAAEAEAVMHHMREFYNIAYEDGQDDALGRPRRHPVPRPLRLVWSSEAASS
jgi:hypothetical protein